MTTMTRQWAAAGVAFVLCGMTAAAQGPALIDDAWQARGQTGVQQQIGPENPNAPRPMVGDGISPADVQSMFDAMLVMDAERFIGLTPEQFPLFVQRVKKLQEAKGNQMRRHNRAFGELRAMSNPQTGRADDASIDAKLKELEAIEVEAHAALSKALEAIDQMLTPRQRARFRLLEDNIEKKKLEFITKVRQPGRGGEGTR